MYVCIICCLSVCPDTLSMMTYYIHNMQSKNDQLPELSLTFKKSFHKQIGLYQIRPFL